MSSTYDLSLASPSRGILLLGVAFLLSRREGLQELAGGYYLLTISLWTQTLALDRVWLL